MEPLAVASLEHYGELGCEIFLEGSTSDDTVVLYIGAEETSGKTLIAGYDLKRNGNLIAADEKTTLPGWKKNTGSTSSSTSRWPSRRAMRRR